VRARAATQGTASDYGRFFSAGYGPTTYRFLGLQDLSVDPATGLHRTQAGLAKSVLDALEAVGRQIACTVQASTAGPPVRPGIHAPKPTPELRLRPRV
jgi:hypothetical protein